MVRDWEKIFNEYKTSASAEAMKLENWCFNNGFSACTMMSHWRKLHPGEKFENRYTRFAKTAKHDDGYRITIPRAASYTSDNLPPKMKEELDSLENRTAIRVYYKNAEILLPPRMTGRFLQLVLAYIE